MHKNSLILASILLAAAVALGAFGAHGLKELVPPQAVNSFETGVRYHFYHSFAILAAAIIYASFPLKGILTAARLFLTGIILFSGSLYAMALLQVKGAAGLSGIGIITPFGGLFFIAGWLVLAITLARSKR